MSAGAPAAYVVHTSEHHGRGQDADDGNKQDDEDGHCDRHYDEDDDSDENDDAWERRFAF